jgi:hypothetical protein
MGAFGSQRHANLKVDDGHVKLVQGELKSENVLPLFEEYYRHSETQKGQTSFGAHRKNVDKVVDSHVYDSADKVRLSEGIIPRVSMGSNTTQDDLTPIGSLRSQKINVKYKENMSEGFDKQSNSFLSRQFQPNSAEIGGSHIMDRRRNVVPNIEGGPSTHKQETDGIVPLLLSTAFIDKKSGDDFCSFRPTVH